MRKGSHFHTADNEKGRYNQHHRHYPENFEGYKKKGKNEETKGVKNFE